MTLEENLEEKSQEAAPAEQPVEQKSSPQKAEPKIEIDETTKCPECHSTHLVRDYERGELVCEECGLVVDENAIDRREGLYNLRPRGASGT